MNIYIYCFYGVGEGDTLLMRGFFYFFVLYFYRKVDELFPEMHNNIVRYNNE